MDANKKQKLEDIAYIVQRSCGLCRHGHFKPDQLFGDCAIETYTHLKHTGDPKHLSVVRYGLCPSFEPDPVKMGALHNYVEFLDQPE
jgi:hypothetical protein